MRSSPTYDFVSKEFHLIRPARDARSQSPALSFYSLGLMTTFHRIRALGVGAAAVSGPAIALALISTYVVRELSLGPLVASLGATLILVGGMAWACVGVARFPRALSALLATWPFVALGVILIRTRLAGAVWFGIGQLLLALLFAWAGTATATGQILLSSRRLSYMAIGVVSFVLIWELTVQFTAIPIHAFDNSWHAHQTIPLDTRIARMAKRAQFDSYVSGIPPIGRGRLQSESTARHNQDYDLFFTPTWVSDTLVVYRFRVDGKPLWKTCNWVETN